MLRFRLQALIFATLVPACAASGPGGNECAGGKCDDPGQSASDQCAEECGSDESCKTECRDRFALQHCEARRADALSSSQRVFREDAIRWACADVEGVNTNGGDTRGKEYCEYFAVVQPPADASGAMPPVADLGRAGGPLSIELDEEQIFALEDEPDAVVGQCLFTAWHLDVREPLPVCGGSEAGCPSLGLDDGARAASWLGEDLGFALTEEHVKMASHTNSRGAAVSLLRDCLQGTPAGDPDDPDDPLHDEFMRGCWKAYQLFGTEWRRSDSAICTAGVRLSECGCGVDSDSDGAADVTDPREISEALVSDAHRGFHLGTWTDRDALPAGCRYVETGDDTGVETLVACDLTATDLLGGASDMQAVCGDKYGDNVVVYVDVPSAAVTCEPAADSAYGDTCTATPWVL